jgi:hypothetical protein
MRNADRAGLRSCETLRRYAAAAGAAAGGGGCVPLTNWKVKRRHTGRRRIDCITE